jgi:hypothetical protein
MKIKSSDLAKMSKDERNEALKKLAHAAQQPPTEETIAEWKKKVASHEEQYQMTSDEMRKKLKSGEIIETFEICKWLMDLHVLDRLIR